MCLPNPLLQRQLGTFRQLPGLDKAQQELFYPQRTGTISWRIVVAYTTLAVEEDAKVESRVLVTWLGNHDCWAMAESLGGEVADLVEQQMPANRAAPGRVATGPGPIMTLVEHVAFREIHVISNFASDVSDAYKDWINARAPTVVHSVSLKDPVSERENPTNYRAVYGAASEVLEAVRACLRTNEKLCIHLSPGTPTMAAVSVLLGKTRFPATLYQTYQGAFSEVDLPFDITVDVVPELLRDADRSLQLLSSRVPGEVDGFEGIVGRSRSIRLAVGRAQRAAIRDINLLLLGESGTGKEVFARAIHRASYRGKTDAAFKKFVAVNCAAIPEQLFESELFGHRKGAFTGADRDKVGKIEAADGGTLFLDEVGECSLDNQAKLLRALQPRRDDRPCMRWVCRVGDTEERSFDVRIVAATNRPLLESVASREFRDDLYYRLATVAVELPPLRDRRTDIELLANDILNRVNREFEPTEPGYVPKKLTAPALRRLKEHYWPGNVRELTNVLYQAAVMQSGDAIGRGDIEAAIPKTATAITEGPLARSRGEDFKLKSRLDQIERLFVEDAMEETSGNQTRAAELLGISQQALNKKMRNWQDA